MKKDGHLIDDSKSEHPLDLSDNGQYALLYLQSRNKS